ncbi:carbamate kinase [Actinomadura craniellae]|uniref:Carbamate kinase n=1 Tax=Actinomadura craniellae TaxID=2231787 RepID=A0A365H4T5_9ACTN|nr:carbamate kinase [Actinomadura craniellae]
MIGERVLVALGGNAMTAPDGSASPQAQTRAVAAAMEPVADLVAAGAEVVLTHGSGPQVGNLLIKNELAAQVVPPVPLDWCDAQVQATVGVLIMNALDRALADRGASRPVTALVTRTLVDPGDPAFAAPTKPIGRYFSPEEAERCAILGSHWRSYGERGLRRVVASPDPLDILEAPAVTALLDAGHVVVAAGGGGVPVVPVDGAPRGVEAVVDKDLGAALLARLVGASVLVIATEVDRVQAGYGTPQARSLGRTTVGELRALAAAGHFPEGSMGPKVEAAVRFVTSGGRRAAITSLDGIAAAAAGTAGTIVEAENVTVGTQE